MVVLSINKTRSAHHERKYTKKDLPMHGSGFTRFKMLSFLLVLVLHVPFASGSSVTEDPKGWIPASPPALKKDASASDVSPLSDFSSPRETANVGQGRQLSNDCND